MHCDYCHNPETIPIESGQGIEGVEDMTPDQVVERLLPYQKMVSGITISGGECTVQAVFLKALLVALKRLDLPVLLDTNGLRLDVLKEVQEDIAGIMLDIKGLGDAHLILTGHEDQVVWQTFEWALKTHKLAMVRTVLYHNMPYADLLLERVAKKMVAAGQVAPYQLIRFRPHGVKGKGLLIKAPTPQEMARWTKLVKDTGVQIVSII